MSTPPRVLAFDTFGTVADWLGGISAAVARTVPEVDAGEFARQWRARYSPAIARVEAGEIGWRGLDDLQADTLAEVAAQFGVAIDDDRATHLVHAWREIPGWPDSARGLTRLRRRFTVCALSNGSVALLTEMAKRNYLGLAGLMEARPDEVMMVATHQSDLDAARSHGLRSAFVERPLEWGDPELKDDSGSPDNDIHARDLDDLADQLGC
ncbi:haloacid dehalogenase type II [Gordonia sp. L191]|uniref:haloacid dehalogenase type II n=1 Tax=Gordonia sp. L191 TaxID=2982699 RepID=UPI0024C0D514|nr:haloacid dehalogenase type II [Gordonia sp. L191]WHU46296.1 haloacid dehalogenase type II [Gordonia sp. L191]